MKVRLVQNGIFTLIDDPKTATIAPEEGFYWIDASAEELEQLQPLFHFHDLAVEDCLNEDEQRPKIETYDDPEHEHYFIVINSIRFDDEDIYLRALNIFLGKHYIITVTATKINELRLIKPVMLEEETNSPDLFLYHLVDLVIDNYFIVTDRIEARLEQLEEDILIRLRKSQMNEIIGLRGEILWLRKSLGPQKELIATLARRDLGLIEPKLQKYFSDIFENAVKIIETFETFKEVMGNLREAYQLNVANRANEIMRVFTAITTIFMPLTFITGIYGMNFESMPGLHQPYGGYIIFGIMGIIGLCMYLLFKKKDWL